MVHCPLKTSNNANAQWVCSSFSLSLSLFTYGIITFSRYAIVVISLAQWFAVYVMCQSDGKPSSLSLGKHLVVVRTFVY